MRLAAAISWADAQPKFFVYAISRLDGAPVYVGATQQPEQRYRQHMTDRIHQQPLRAWVRNNPHVFEVLDTFPTKRMMLDAERLYCGYIKPQFNRR